MSTVSPKFGLRAAPRGQRFGLGLVQMSASAASVPRSPRHLFRLLKSLYSGPLKGAYGSLNGRTEKTLNCGAGICWSSNLRNIINFKVNLGVKFCSRYTHPEVCTLLKIIFPHPPCAGLLDFSLVLLSSPLLAPFLH